MNKLQLQPDGKKAFDDHTLVLYCQILEKKLNQTQQNNRKTCVTNIQQMCGNSWKTGVTNLYK